jgi:pimeloyl-ACP methyl ester carboxylesterase
MHEGEIDGHLVRWRRHGDANVLYVHGVPESSAVWAPFLERTGGVALDLPGFGRSGKRGDFPYDIDGYAAFLGRFADHAGLERVRLVCHDWGAVALAWAMREPERVERLVAIDVVPFLPGYRWHRVARLWRTRVAGELAMGATNRLAMQFGSGLGKEWARAVMADFDQGTQRAILRLYRASDPEVLTAAGAELGRITAPALVIWGERDPYIPTRFGELLAERLGDAKSEVVSGAGHWPWLQDPAVIERVAAFLDPQKQPLSEGIRRSAK